MSKQTSKKTGNEPASIEVARYHALSPLDGRYGDVALTLSPYFSEYALVRTRVEVMVSWMIHVAMEVDSQDMPACMDWLAELDESDVSLVTMIYQHFDDVSMKRVKELERTTHHDVKAAEYYIREQLDEMSEMVDNPKLKKLKSFVHIGCTSEDVTNIAYALMIDRMRRAIWTPQAKDLVDKLKKLAYAEMNTPMLAHTHGQPATPTTVGKEMAVHATRLQRSMKLIEETPILAKMNGATGNYAALATVFPKHNWRVEEETFIEMLGLSVNPVTTQIESHDWLCGMLDELRHFCTLLRNLSKDMRTYISMGYFKQKVVAAEVGSSTMPQKVNPINFENSEGNAELCCGNCQTLTYELPVSWMQRDLTDSTLLRNVGITFGYALQAVQEAIKGLGRVEVDHEALDADLDVHWEVLAEPIQTMLRKYGVEDAYERMKALTRGRQVWREDLQDFIDGLEMLEEEDREILLNLTPATYVGEAANVVLYGMP